MTRVYPRTQTLARGTPLGWYVALFPHISIGHRISLSLSLPPSYLCEEVTSELVQRAEGAVRRYGRGVPRDHTLLPPVHDGDEAVRRRLRSDALSRETALEEVADKGGFADRVLKSRRRRRRRRRGGETGSM